MSSTTTTTPVKLYIVYYSTWMHVHELALALQRGAEKVPGLEIKLFQVAETLPESALTAMHAPPKPDVPTLQPADIVEADGFLFGIPTRYGNMPAQVKAFWDATGTLWQQGGLVGKMAGTFFSTSSQHGGQETTAFTFLTTLAHHGIIYVPLGYSTPLLLDNEQVSGGSPYGAGTLSNPDGSRAVSAREKSIGEVQGESFARTLKAYVLGARLADVPTDVAAGSVDPASSGVPTQVPSPAQKDAAATAAAETPATTPATAGETSAADATSPTSAPTAAATAAAAAAAAPTAAPAQGKKSFGKRLSSFFK